MKKNICVYILAGVFLYPHIFNNLHFVLVDHNFHWSLKKQDETTFKNKSHNCELYLFKVPPTTELSLAHNETIQSNLIYKEIFVNFTKKFTVKYNDFNFKRGPPDL